MKDNMFKSVTTNNIYFYNHYWGVLDSTYDKYKNLDNFFLRTAYSYNSTGGKFIASVEARQYPIYATQYHPEKYFEWKVNSNHTKIALQAQQFMGTLFVNQARKSAHAFTSEAELQRKLIQNYPCVLDEPSSGFNQVYVLPNLQ